MHCTVGKKVVSSILDNLCMYLKGEGCMHGLWLARALLQGFPSLPLLFVVVKSIWGGLVVMTFIV